MPDASWITGIISCSPFRSSRARAAEIRQSERKVFREDSPAPHVFQDQVIEFNGCFDDKYKNKRRHNPGEDESDRAGTETHNSLFFSLQGRPTYLL